MIDQSSLTFITAVEVESMKLTPENVMRLAERLLRAKQELAEAQRDWDRLFSAVPSPNASSEASSKETVATRIVGFLNARPHELFDADSVAKQLHINPMTARTTLSRLVSKRVIEKRGHSNYGAIRQEISDTTAPFEFATEEDGELAA